MSSSSMTTFVLTMWPILTPPRLYTVMCITSRRRCRRTLTAPGPLDRGGASAVTKYVYDFSEGNKDMKDLLGGKGANLAEMTNMGLPVPPGFTITTQACLSYLAESGFPDGLMPENETHLQSLEKAMGKTLGDQSDPLL